MLRRKVLSQFVLIIILSLGLLVVLEYFILREYRVLEAEAQEQRQELAESALLTEIGELNQLTNEWAKSGLLRFLMQPGLQTQLDQTMSVIAGSFNVTKAVAVNGSGEVVSARQWDPETELDSGIDENSSFIHAILQDQSLVSHDGASTFTTGLAVLDGEMYFISSQPVLETPQATSNDGSLILVAPYSSSTFDILPSGISSRVQLTTLEEFADGGENSTLLERLRASGGELVSIPESRQRVDNYTILPDYNGIDRFVLHTAAPRAILQLATQTVVINVVVLLFLLVLMTLFFLYFFDRNILKRLQRIGADVGQLRKSQRLDRRLEVQGADEITNFAAGFNQLLDELQQTQASLSSERERALTTLASIGDAVVATDVKGRIQFINPAAEQLMHCSMKEAHLKPLAEIFQPTNKEGVISETSLAQHCIAQEKEVIDSTYCYLHADTSDEMIIESQASPIYNSKGDLDGVVLVFRDVTLAKNLQKTLAHQASHDTLTGLFNRREFERRLSLVTSNARKRDTQHFMLFIDLDRFKVVNDSCGHIAGDKVLKEIAKLMSEQLRSSDVVARIGGDEFGIILSDCEYDDALRIAENVCEAVAAFRFHAKGKHFTFGASIGLVDLQTISRQSETELLTVGDNACMIAKNSGRNRVHVYKEEDSEREENRLGLWVTRVTEALETDKFELHFQNILDIRDNTNPIFGHELLLRMRGADDELVSPGIFLPAAERYGLMKQIDCLVFEMFCRLLQENQELLSSPVTYFVNLSGQSLSDQRFAASLTSILDKTAISPEKICFEITETAAVHNLSNAKSFMATMKDKGCKFALDDFGSGLSSFAYLKQLPVDIVKIDGAFIRTIDQEPVDRSMVNSINDIAHTRGLETIAEFVENEAILRIAKELGIDYAQGYHLHKPESIGRIKSISEAGTRPVL